MILPQTPSFFGLQGMFKFTICRHSPRISMFVSVDERMLHQWARSIQRCVRGHDGAGALRLQPGKEHDTV